MNMDACKLHDPCKTRTHAQATMDVDADDAKAKASCFPIQAAERLRCIICSSLRHVLGCPEAPAVQCPCHAM
jgi:hypothetical protein